MTTEPKRMFYQVEYWSCDNPEHRHKTKEVALKCNVITKQQRRWTEEMYTEVLERRRSGETLRSIGDSFGVGAQRIRQVEETAKRQAHEREFFKLNPKGTRDELWNSWKLIKWPKTEGNK